VQSGDAVLELGCADGFSTAGLANAGLHVTAVDHSAKNLDEAQKRLRGLEASVVFQQLDINHMELDRSFDAVLGLMGTFFRYMADPEATVRMLAAHTRVKLLVDVNPREMPLSAAVAAVRAAGFPRVAWRPFFVPQRYRLSGPAALALGTAEHLPLVRGALLHYKFVVVVKGEWNPR